MRSDRLGPLDPIYDVDTQYGGIATGNTPGVPIVRVTINKAAGQDDPTNDSPVLFTVVFTEAVTGFATGDVVLTGGSGATTGVVTGGPTTYTVSVTGMSTNGNVTANVPAGVATGIVSGEANAHSTSTDNTVAFQAPPPISMALVGTPYAGPTIAYYGDFDPATQYLIVGDVYASDCGPYIFDCTTDNPTLVGTVFVPAGSWTARWGVTNATAWYLGNHFSPGFDGIYPVNTSNPALPTVGALVPDLNEPIDFFRHGSRLLIWDNTATALRRGTISGSTLTLTGTSIAGLGGFGCGHPNDPDTVFTCQGSSLTSVDISGISPAPRQVYAPGGSFDAGRCAAIDNTLFVLGNGIFSVFDITDPNSITLSGSLSNGNFNGGGAVAPEPNGLYVYVTNGLAGTTKRIDALNCTNPGTPTVECSLLTPGLANLTDMFYNSTRGDHLVLVSQTPRIQSVEITR